MIVRTRNQGQIELRSFSLGDMVKYGYDGLRNFSRPVNQKAMHGVPALHRAARLRAEAIASLHLYCWSGYGAQRQRRDQVWQAQLFCNPANDFQSRFGFWETVGESLAWRNNAYYWKNVDPLSGRIVEWFALHPDQVQIMGPNLYRVTVMDGFIDPVGRGKARYEVDESTVTHIRGHGDGGQLEAPTPLEVFKDALASPINRQRHEARMWTRGATLQGVIEVPEALRADDLVELKEGWQRTFEGTDGETTGVLGGGATFKPIGMTAADAQYVDMAKLTVHDASRIMGVPANLLGAQTERPVPNLEQDIEAWWRFGLGPECERIEAALAADDDLFGNAHTYPKFDTENFVRGDVATQDLVAHQQIQDGRLLVDEWRAMNGLPPLPGGVGKIPQITPVGGGANQSQPQPDPPQQSGDDENY